MPDHVPTAPATETEVVRSFLEHLQADDLDAALDLLADDVVYTNVSLPTVRGRRSVERVFRPMSGRAGFRVHFHGIGVDESDRRLVLTDRTDALILGPVHMQFWVYGRFIVEEGRITLWRDHFDWRDSTVGLIRGLLGVVVPAWGRTWPAE